MDKKSRELVMAKLYLKNKDYKMAENSFQEYLSMNPEDVAALKLLAQVYEQSKRFDKAFEMYERCYLAEPDRTGVLLDICRILLMNEIWLSHVDYRKWLNLAIKAFPSNPVVVNFKAFLSTLPPDEHASPQRTVSTNPTPRLLIDDPLNKILEKLSTMEKRLESIEDKISNLKLARPIQAPAVTTPKPASIQAPTFTTASITAPPLPTPITPPKTASVSIPQPALNTTPQTAPIMTPQSASIATPQSVLKPSSIAAPQLASVTVSQTSTVVTPQPAQNSTPQTFQMFKPIPTTPSQPVFQSTLQSSPQSVFQPSLQFTSQPLPQSTNLFAESIAKLNISSWSKTPEQTNNKDVQSGGKGFFSSDTKSIFGTKPFEFKSSEGTSSEGNKSTGSIFASSAFGGFKPFEFKANEEPTTTHHEEAEGDGDEVAPNEELPIENTCTMQPIAIKTGEEDEDILFEQRCKLFRFRDKEYKERGLGSIKVLKHKSTGKGRLIMRREAIGLVCLNCWDCSKIERVRDTQVRWVGLDASDGEPEPTVFLARFKTQEMTDTFMSHLTELFPIEPSSANTSISSPQSKTNVFESSVSKTGTEKPDVELVDPQLNQSLVDKARKLQLPDLFYHKLKNQEPCGGCNGCENED